MSKQELSNHFITRKEVSKLLKVSLGTVDNYTKKGLLKPKGIGNRVLFVRTDVINALIDL